MHRSRSSANGNIVVDPFQRLPPKSRRAHPKAKRRGSKTKARASSPAPSSALPGILIASLCLVLLGVGAGTALYYWEPAAPVVVEQDAAEDDELEEELDPVGQTALPVPEDLQPILLDLSGDPIVIPRQGAAGAPVQEINVTGSPAASAIGVSTSVYRLTDELVPPDTQLMSTLPASQQNLAFFQPANSDIAVGETGASEAGEGLEGKAASDNTSVYALTRAEGAGPGATRESIVRLNQEATPASVLASNGWSADDPVLLESAIAEIWAVQTLGAGDVIAVKGFASQTDPTRYVPAQLSLYRNGGTQYAGTIALSDFGKYGRGVDPWHGRPIREPIGGFGGQPSNLRLLDAIYAAAMRHEAPSVVIGETFLVLSRTHDLNQPAKPGDKITLVYSTSPRDRSTGSGKIIYVRIDREQNDIECYVFQPDSGRDFECVSGDGYSRQISTGMVTPVKGVLAAKFGPRKDRKTGKAVMHPGIAWTAPAGTPVVAAFAGTVEVVGTDDNFGNHIKISHSDGTKTGYRHLQKFAPGLSEGSSVAAGDVIGYVGKTGDTEEPRLFFELIRNGAPVDPFELYQKVIERGGAVEALVNRIIQIESAGNPNAKNPLSTATGLGQFIDSTWLRMISVYRPDLMQKLSRKEVLDLRRDPEIARAMLIAFTRENESALRSRGHSVTPGNLYLAHFLGVGDAARMLSSSPERPLAAMLSSAVISANGFLKGKTVGWVVNWAARKMSGAKVSKVASAPEPPRQKYAANERFLAMKRAIQALLEQG